MPRSKETPTPVRDQARHFATTRWSLVLAAGRRGGAESKQALATLCQTYWYPLYAYVRRRGYHAEEAQDLTQEFFARFLEADAVQVADPGRGRFRWFLLVSLKNFLAKQWRDANAHKRKGDRVRIAFDFPAGEGRYALEPSHEETAERLFERQWAVALIEEALARLQQDYAASGKQEVFEQLRIYLAGEETTIPYQQVAPRLHMTEGAVKVAVYRLRRRCRDLLRAEIAQTVATPDEVEDELRALFQAVAL